MGHKWDEPPEETVADTALEHAEAEYKRVQIEQAKDDFLRMVRERDARVAQFKEQESKLVPGHSKAEVQTVLILLSTSLIAGLWASYSLWGIPGALYAWAAWAMAIWIFGGNK